MNVKQKLNQGKAVIGGWLQISHPSAAEAMNHCGYDFLTVDAEHGDCDLTAITNTMRGMGDTPAFVRVRENDTIAIRQALDNGAQGVIVPLVETAEQAQKAVAAAKYPPTGIRGFAYTRANGWGAEFDDYTARANNEIAVIVMIETARAIDNIDEILSVEGLDGVLIGPYDLSGSLGVIGQTEHPLVVAAQYKMLTACLKHNKAAGIHLVTPSQSSVQDVIARGFRLLVLGMDTVFIARYAQDAIRCAWTAMSNY